jgi:hypothetical protein
VLFPCARWAAMMRHKKMNPTRLAAKNPIFHSGKTVPLSP